jgi:hypothetical protein
MDVESMVRYGAFVIFACGVVCEIGLAEAPAVYYVAPNGNNAWSGTREAPSGNDGPWLTISKAREVVRSRIAAGMTSDITVLIRGGEYFQNYQLNFGPQDSGDNGHRVIYRNYPGEQPFIHRGRKITGWQLDTGSIYKAPVDWTFNALYENGVRAMKARHPNVTDSNLYVYSPTSAAVAGSETCAFVFRAGDIPVVGDPTALEVCIWNGGPEGIRNWWRDDWSVGAIDYTARIVTLLKDLSATGDARGDGFGPGTRYFVQGARELLDQAGEFCVANGFVYYWPRRTPIDQQEIVAPGPGGIFGFYGDNEPNTVRDMQVEGLTLACTDRYQSVITLENAERIALRGLHIFNAGGNGIHLIGATTDCVIQGNLLHDIGARGIRAVGKSGAGGADPSRNLIDNNHIFRAGQIAPGASGIELSNANSNFVTHNLVHDVPRCGIGIWGAAQSSPDSYVPHAANNTVAYNDISHAMNDTQDAAPLYTWGAGPGNVFTNNRIHDSNVAFSFGEGLYLDDDTFETTVSNNLLHDLQQSGGGITFSGIEVKGSSILVANNIVAQNHLSAGDLHLNRGNDSYLVPNQNIRILRNIFAGNNTDRFYACTYWDETELQAADYNVFLHEEGVYNVGFGYSGTFSRTGDQGRKETLAQWRAGHGKRYDQNSVVADPGFVDAANRDFRLRPDSPASVLGFTDIDYGAMGLTADYPFTDQNDPLARLFVTTSQSGPGATTRLAPNQTTRMTITGRTKTGYLVSLPCSAGVFSSNASGVAQVDVEGTIKAVSPGSAVVMVSVTRSGATARTVMCVIVEVP